jgi:hypothetical protein
MRIMEKLVGTVGPRGDPAMEVGSVVRVRMGGGVIAKGESGRVRVRGSGESGGDGQLVGLVCSIGTTEVLTHLLKGESALGDIGGAKTAAGVALYETLGEKKVCYAFSPDLDILLGP